MKKHLILGTAGHVDHGKTSLIRALTGYDCDTHKEEKSRGITINLGFTHLDMPNGDSLGIVDVPGHADFIKTTVSGASGLDMVALIIAADEGIMPQTREHLAIMDLLGIRYGCIVLTKIDMVDEEILMLAEEEVREFVDGTFLADSQLIKVSSITNEGIEDLIHHLQSLIDIIPQRTAEGYFRLYIDRIFSQPGFGTIVNGSVLSGELHKKDPLYLLPGNKEIKIRRFERHGGEVDVIRAGDRASMNLANFKVKEFERGMMLSGKQLESTKLVDVRIRLFKDSTTLSLWNQVIFMIGTIRMMVRVHLLDTNYLEPGNEALAQIYFPKEVAVQLNDKFIIRKSSGDKTLGGGVVVDPYPLHHRRRRSKHIDLVKEMSSGNLVDLIVAEVRKSVNPISYRQIAEHLAEKPDDLIDPIFQELRGDIVFIQPENEIILMEKKARTSYQNKILNSLIHYHKKNSLFDTGRSFNELMGIFGENRGDINKITLRMILKQLVEDGKLRVVGSTWALADHNVTISDETKAKIDLIDMYIKQSAKEFVDPDDIWLDLKDKFRDEKEVDVLIKYLLKKDEILFIKQMYINAEIYNKRKKQLTDYLLENEETGLQVSVFRDMINSNRNTAVLYLEHFDSEGVTIRKENQRFLTQRYKNSIT